MRRTAIVILLACGLLAWPVELPAQGKPDHPGAGKAAEKHMQRAEKAAEKQVEKAAKTRERADERPGGELEERDRGKAVGRPEHAASETPGFFDGVRRFFGFGRSQERQSASGAEHTQAPEKRGPEQQED